MDNFDFIAASDRPALLAVSTHEWRCQIENALMELGYKVHAAEDHGQFHFLFNQTNYEIVVIEETFCSSPEDNTTLKTVQSMPMAQRRHATIILIGANFESLNALQAFAQSVQCVVNFSEMPLIGQLMQKAVVENQTFMAPFLAVQRTAHLNAPR